MTILNISSEIHARRKEFDKALEYAQRAIDKKFNNEKARNLKAFLLIKLDRMKDAKKTVKENLNYDSKDYMSHQMSLKFEVGRYMETAWIDYIVELSFIWRKNEEKNYSTLNYSNHGSFVSWLWQKL